MGCELQVMGNRLFREVSGFLLYKLNIHCPSVLTRIGVVSYKKGRHLKYKAALVATLYALANFYLTGKHFSFLFFGYGYFK